MQGRQSQDPKDHAFTRSARAGARTFKVLARAAWAVNAVLFIGIALLAVFAAERVGIMIPWMVIAYLPVLLAAVVLTGLAVLWSRTEQAAETATTRGGSTRGLQVLWVAGITLVVLYLLRDVLFAAFTDGPGPSDRMEFLIGSGLVAGLAVAAISALRDRLASRAAPMPVTSDPSAQGRRLHDAEAPARRSFNRFLVVVAVAFALAFVYVLSVRV